MSSTPLPEEVRGELPGPLDQVLALLRSSARMLWNAAFLRGRRRRLGTVVGICLGALLWGLAVPLLRGLLTGPLGAPSGRLLAALGGAMVLLSGFSLITSVSFAVASAYFSRDVEWLLTLPLSGRAILAHRLASQLLLGAMVGLALLGPLLLAAAIDTRSLPLLPLVALALLALLAFPIALGLWLVVMAVRLVPASRVRDATAAAVSLVGFALAALEVSGRSPGSGLSWSGSMAALGKGWLGRPFLPPGWAARALAAAWDGNALATTLWLLPLLLLAGLALTLSVYWAGPQYRRGWVKAQMAPRRSRRSVPSRWRLGPVTAVLLKDWRGLRRDPVQLSQLVLPLGLFAVYLVLPAAGGGSLTLFHDFPLWYGPLTTSAFAAMFVASGLGLRAIGSEGGQLWCLRCSPLSTRQLLLGKLALPLLTALGASSLLLWAAELRAGLPLSEIGFSTVLLLPCVGGLAALATGLGAIWPRLDWTDPRRATGIWLSVAFLVIGSAYVVACLVALTVPLVLPHLGADAGAVAGCCLCAGLTALVALRLGYLRLLRLEG